MPYSPQKDRIKFNQALVTLEDDLTAIGTKPLVVGELNYVISSLIWRIFDQLPSYTLANDLVGVLECVKQEFIRRRLNGYENEKILENGDL